MSRRHCVRPDFDRAIWLQQQMATDDLPITDNDVVRFGHNPEVCLTHLCRESRYIDASITDLTLGPNNQPAWLEACGDHSVLVIGGTTQPTLEGEGVAPAALWGFLSSGMPVISWSSREKFCLHVGTQYQDFDNLADVGIKIIEGDTLFIWGWKHADPFGNDRSEAYLWIPGTREEVRRLGSWSSRITGGFGVDLENLFVRFDLHQGLGPTKAKMPRGLHSLRLGCEVQSDSKVLDVFGTATKLRFITSERHAVINNCKLVFKGSEPSRFHYIDELKIPAPYAGGHCSVRGHLAYKVSLRHQQVAWVIGRDELQPAMNQVTDLFEHPEHGWCYWGSVGQHLCLMKVAFPD